VVATLGADEGGAMSYSVWLTIDSHNNHPGVEYYAEVNEAVMAGSFATLSEAEELVSLLAGISEHQKLEAVASLLATRRDKERNNA